MKRQHPNNESEPTPKHTKIDRTVKKQAITVMNRYSVDRFEAHANPFPSDVLAHGIYPYFDALHVMKVLAPVCRHWYNTVAIARDLEMSLYCYEKISSSSNGADSRNKQRLDLINSVVNAYFPASGKEGMCRSLTINGDRRVEIELSPHVFDCGVTKLCLPYNSCITQPSGAGSAGGALEGISVFSGRISSDASTQDCFAPFVNCVGMRELNIDQHKSMNLSSLSAMSRLGRLTLIGTKISNLESLNNLKHLSFLSLCAVAFLNLDHVLVPSLKELELRLCTLIDGQLSRNDQTFGVGCYFPNLDRISLCAVRINDGNYAATLDLTNLMATSTTVRINLVNIQQEINIETSEDQHYSLRSISSPYVSHTSISNLVCCEYFSTDSYQSKKELVDILSTNAKTLKALILDDNTPKSLESPAKPFLNLMTILKRVKLQLHYLSIPPLYNSLLERVDLAKLRHLKLEVCDRLIPIKPQKKQDIQKVAEQVIEADNLTFSKVSEMINLETFSCGAVRKVDGAFFSRLKKLKHLNCPHFTLPNVSSLEPLEELQSFIIDLPSINFEEPILGGGYSKWKESYLVGQRRSSKMELIIFCNGERKRSRSKFTFNQIPIISISCASGSVQVLPHNRLESNIDYVISKELPDSGDIQKEYFYDLIPHRY